MKDIWKFFSILAVAGGLAACNKEEEKPIDDDERFEDLGLSVKWAKCNLGATSPEKYGDYFAWGETEPYYVEGNAQKTDHVIWKGGKNPGYDWNSYKWCEGTYNSLLKYNNNGDFGVVDNKVFLDPEDDAAHVALGDNCRMPTPSEWEELSDRSNCKWEWTALEGVPGYKVTSLKSGFTENWIFLPAAGQREGTSLLKLGEIGYYWSSWVDEPESRDISRMFLFFESYHNTSYCSRHKGNSVRPVAD